jgi:hypothetical protein
MFKRSLLTIAILGAFAAAAGAHSEGEVEKAKGLQTPQLEFVFEAAPAACGVDGSEAQSEAWFDSLLEQQNATRLEEGEAESLYARRWGGGSSWCLVCTYYCWWVRC